MKALLVALMLLCPTPAHAVPVTPTLGAISLTAPACGWTATLLGSPESPGSFAPACAGLVVTAILGAGDQVRLETVLAEYPQPFTTLAAAVFGPTPTEVSRDVRVTAGGTELIALTAPPGSTHLWLSLMAFFDPILVNAGPGFQEFDVARGVGFYFDLTYPFMDDPPLTHTPENGTLLLVGSSMAWLGWRVRRGQ